MVLCGKPTSRCSTTMSSVDLERRLEGGRGVEICNKY